MNITLLSQRKNNSTAGVKTTVIQLQYEDSVNA
jgi:hypothetical protein